jgi:hypothetical protein
MTALMTPSDMRQAAGDGQVTGHHARKAHGAERAGPAAIERGQLAQHLQVLRADQRDVQRGGRHGGDDRHPPRGAGDDAVGLFVQRDHEVALGQLDPVGGVHDGLGVIAQLRHAPAHVGAAGIDVAQVGHGAVGGLCVIGGDGARGICLCGAQLAHAQSARRSRGR